MWRVFVLTPALVWIAKEAWLSYTGYTLSADHRRNNGGVNYAIYIDTSKSIEIDV